MAYIQPNSVIEFFSDLNLSDNYYNTLYFPTTQAKDSYFDAITPIGRVLTCTYTREKRGYVRVELPISTLIGATYMRFKNTSFENKWFYAFVKSVDYVNNQTTEVKFSIDYLMTWTGTFTLNECYIERQHTVNDGIGNNIAEEGLSVGEYVTEANIPYSMGASRIVMVYLPDSQSTAEGHLLGGIYSGYNVAVFNNVSDLNRALDGIIQKNLINNVISIFMCYSNITNSLSLDNGVATGGGQGGETVTLQKPYSSINGYVPRNKKLFCYPYKYLVVDNSEGDQKEYCYEYFNSLPDSTSSGNAEFLVNWVINSKCEVAVSPKNYKGYEFADYTNKIGMSHFPMCAWGSDTYMAYLAEKNAYLEHDVQRHAVRPSINGAIMGTRIGTAIGGTVGSAVPGMGTLTGAVGGGMLGATLGGWSARYKSDAMEIAENLVDNIIRPTSPEISHGDQSIDLMFSNAQKTFRFIEKCITKNYAMMLDSYFDMFGYAVRQHGVPNMNARPNWTYVKTIGCSVGGNIPADDAGVIESIFNNGIRFWKNHNNIGNYSLNNAPANN